MKYLFTFFLFLITHNLLFAQKEIILSDTGKNGIVKFQRFDTSINPKLSTNEKEVLRQTLRLNFNDSFRLDKTVPAGNFTNKIYQQFYKGYKVVGGTYATHSKNGKLESINGFFQKIGDITITPSIDEKTALNKALFWVGAIKYGWEDKYTESLYKEQMRDSSATLKPKGKLLILFDDSLTHSYRLAYKFLIYAVMPLVDKNIYIDAISGNIIKVENLILDGNIVGSAATLYSGTQTITMDSYSSPVKYRLQETRSTNGKTAQIQTYNMQNGGNYNTAIDFSNVSTNWTTLDAGLDVQWGTEKVFDYWSTVRNRNSFDNNGSALKGYVHTNLVTLGYLNNDNAFWSGTMHIMTYGDGSTQFNPVVSLDVIAHEIGHGICQNTANLPSQSEGGALNEGLSDIWGAVIENWAAPNKQTWEIGEDIMKNGQPCLRSLDNPKSLGYPDTYLGTYWASTANPSQYNDNGGVHKNSTILSHWFYLLCEGGSGTNDLNNSYNVSGIGISEAANIVWNAESTGKLLSQSQYADARTAMISAATDLYGASSNEVIQVTCAWYAVGVGSDYDFTGTYPILGPSSTCGSAAYNVGNLPQGATVTWSASPSGIATLTPNGNTVTLNKTGTGLLALSAAISINGGAPFSVTDTITVGGCVIVKNDGSGAIHGGVDFINSAGGNLAQFGAPQNSDTISLLPGNYNVEVSLSPGSSPVLIDINGQKYSVNSSGASVPLGSIFIGNGTYAYGYTPYYSNTAKTGNFTRNNCTSGQAGTTVTYTVPANTYFSGISQIDADTLAQNALNTQGQSYVNTNGSCVQPSVNMQNNSDGRIYCELKQGTSTIYSTFLDPGNNITTSTIPAGDYTVNLQNAGPGSLHEFVIDGNSQTGYSASYGIHLGINVVYISVSDAGSNYAYSISPNPASTSINIEPANKSNPAMSSKSINSSTSNTDNSAITEINIYDQSGNVKSREKMGKGAKRGSVNISGLSKGIYFVEIVTEKNKEKHQLIIQR